MTTDNYSGDIMIQKNGSLSLYSTTNLPAYILKFCLSNLFSYYIKSNVGNKKEAFRETLDEVLILFLWNWKDYSYIACEKIVDRIGNAL